MATPISQFADVSDKLSWASSPSGKFDTKNAYSIAYNNSLFQNKFYGNWIWKVDTLPKVQMFTWKCYLGCMLVKDVLYKRGIEIDTICGGCGERHETILHVLCDGCIVRKLWEEAGATSYVLNFFNLDLCGWLKVICTSKEVSKMELRPWRIFFTFAIWSLWLNRNN